MNSILKNKKISETPFRKEVLAIFENYKNAIPLSVIEKDLKDYNRITLYRTIKLFTEKGIIHEITISGEDSNYALCKEDCSSNEHEHQHIHFKCTQCLTIFCVEMDAFPKVSIPNYTINQLEIQATGICVNCN
jgi:Fur family ferric uptake transcriptional regulator